MFHWYRRIVDIYYPHMLITGTVLGANVGMYNAVTNKERGLDMCSTVGFSTIVGFVGGTALPVFLPIAIATLPAYGLATLRSSGASSPQKEGKLA
jgi:hypothetical protein